MEACDGLMMWRGVWVRARGTGAQGACRGPWLWLQLSCPCKRLDGSWCDHVPRPCNVRTGRRGRGLVAPVAVAGELSWLCAGGVTAHGMGSDEGRATLHLCRVRPVKSTPATLLLPCCAALLHAPSPTSSASLSCRWPCCATWPQPAHLRTLCRVVPHKNMLYHLLFLPQSNFKR